MAGGVIAVSIIIPHYNDLAALDRCLEAIVGQIDRGSTEIIVADNGSPAGLAAVEAIVAGRARVVIATERGAGPARNAGVAAAGGSTLAFIDCDCLATPGWLAAGLAGLAAFDVVGGPVRVSTGAAPRSGAEIFEIAFAFQNERYIADEGFTGSGNLFCARATFHAVGGFAIGVSEDKDWCHRATALGYSLGLAPTAVISHPARRSWSELTHKWRRITRETMLFDAAAGQSVWRWRLRQIAVAASPLLHGWKLLRMPGLTLAERRRGLGTLIALRLWRAWDGLRLAYPRR